MMEPHAKMKCLETERCTEEREARRGLQSRTNPASVNRSGKCPPELAANGVFQEAEGNEKEGGAITENHKILWR